MSDPEASKLHQDRTEALDIAAVSSECDETNCPKVVLQLNRITIIDIKYLIIVYIKNEILVFWNYNELGNT